MSILPGGRPAQAPKPGAKTSRRIGRAALPAVAVVAALVAFLVARNQAQGPDEATPPPAAGLPNTPDYHSLLVAPTDPNQLWLGTHVGIYESLDGGRSWTFAGLEGQDAMNLGRTQEGTVWAAGHDVLARSSDGGKTWTSVRPEGLPGLDVHGFAIDPDNRSLLYAAVAGEGLYRSSDGGESFELVSTDVGPGVLGMAVAPGGRLLAADPGQGLMASDDGGATWSVVLPESVVGVAVSPGDPKMVVATGPGIFLSRDGGTTWSRVLSIDEGAGPVAWSPSDPDIGYVVGFDRTLYRTADGGATWQPLDS